MRAATNADLSLSLRGVTVRRGDRTILDDVTLAIPRGQLVAVIGPSGAGKSTLLETFAGIRRPVSGQVVVHGLDEATGRRRPARPIAFVPQDDIVHRDLTVRRSLRYAAALRLPAGDDHAAAVEAVMDDLGLTARAGQAVGSLSGGERKRVSIAVELLARPDILLLDEPTAGLDPFTAASLMDSLRALAQAGRTVVVSTHNMSDLAAADAVAVLSPRGGVTHFGAVADVVGRLGLTVPARSNEVPQRHHAIASSIELPAAAAAKVPFGGQWRVLTRRNREVLLRNPLTLAIMIGAPLLVVAMFAVLFTPGAFEPAARAAGRAAMVEYWLAFAGFFFGLTFGLLQICTEIAIARRERFAGVRDGAYLAAKVSALLPMLFGVDVVMVTVLRWLDRLPAMPPATVIRLLAVILLDELVALLLGLLVSAWVADAAQATIALPMVCFPAVLFAGGILPVHDMATAGQMISVVTPARWAFEAVAGAISNGAAARATVALAVTGAACAAATVVALRVRLRAH